jgi:hypothetical protein
MSLYYALIDEHCIEQYKIGDDYPNTLFNYDYFYVVDELYVNELYDEIAFYEINKKKLATVTLSSNCYYNIEKYNSGFLTDTVEIHKLYDYNNLDDHKKILSILNLKNMHSIMINIHDEVILDFLKNQNFNFITHFYMLICNACGYGNITIIKWVYKNYKNYFDECNFLSNMVYVAAINEQEYIMEWFKNYGYSFTKNKQLINDLSRFGHVRMLNWFKKSNFKFTLNNKNIKNMISLQWHKNNGLKLKLKYIKKYLH